MEYHAWLGSMDCLALQTSHYYLSSCGSLPLGVSKHSLGFFFSFPPSPCFSFFACLQQAFNLDLLEVRALNLKPKTWFVSVWLQMALYQLQPLRHGGHVSLLLQVGKWGISIRGVWCRYWHSFQYQSVLFPLPSSLFFHVYPVFFWRISWLEIWISCK
jgi:hypothetical protein